MNADPSRIDAIPTQWSLVRDAHQAGTPQTAAAARQAIVLRYAKSIRRYIGGIVKQSDDADELARLCRRFRLAAHVNLIPLNPTPGWPTRGTAPRRVQQFRDLLESKGVNATVRRNRGTDIDAACGQLAAGQPVQLGRRSRIPEASAPAPGGATARGTSGSRP